MIMAKSKQIDFSLVSKSGTSDRQENIIEETIFSQNSQISQVSFVIQKCSIIFSILLGYRIRKFLLRDYLRNILEAFIYKNSSL